MYVFIIGKRGKKQSVRNCWYLRHMNLHGIMNLRKRNDRSCQIFVPGYHD